MTFRILAIGDPHGDLSHVKRLVARATKREPIDAIILTGDLGDSDLLRKLTFQKKPATKTQWKAGIVHNIRTAERLVRFLAKQAPTYTIYGNIEYSNAYIRKLEKEHGTLPRHDDLLAAIPNVHVINYRAVRIGTLRVGGIPFFRDTTWAKTFAPKNAKLLAASAKETARVERTLARFGKLDVLVCHAPPHGGLDVVTSKFLPPKWIGKHAGSKALLSYVHTAKPKLVLCGHIHEGKGVRTVGKTTIRNLGCGGSYIFTA